MVVQSVVNSIMSSITYVLSEDGCDYVWLVDCGDSDKILEIIGERQIKGILLTHAHYDHIYGLPVILARFPYSVIYTNEAGVAGLESDKKNLSKYHEDSIIIPREKINIVSEGDIIELFAGKEASVIETPGHNPSCVCFALCDYLFTGDALIPGVPVVNNLPGGNKSMAEESKIRISALSKTKKVLSGHYV